MLAKVMDEMETIDETAELEVPVVKQRDDNVETDDSKLSVKQTAYDENLFSDDEEEEFEFRRGMTGNVEKHTVSSVRAAIMKYNHYYEEIKGECVPYFDFDKVFKTEKELNDFIPIGMDALEQAFEAVFEAPAILYYASSHGWSKKGFKFSYHVVVRKIGKYACGVDVQNTFVSRLDEALADSGLKCDVSVYKAAGSRQLMRTIYSTKEEDKRTMKPIGLGGAISDDQFKNYLITWTEGEKLIAMPKAVEKKKEEKTDSEDAWEHIGDNGEYGSDKRVLTFEQITQIVNGLNTERFGEGKYDAWCHLLWAVARWQETTKADKVDTIEMLDNYCQTCSGYESTIAVMRKYNEASKRDEKSGKVVTVGTLIHWLKEDNPELYREMFSNRKHGSIWEENHEFFYSDFLTLAGNEEADVEDVKKYLKEATCRILMGGKNFFLTKNREPFGEGDRIMPCYTEVANLFDGHKQRGKIVVKEYKNPEFNEERKESGTNKKTLELTIGGVLDDILNDKTQYPTYEHIVFKPYSGVDTAKPYEFNLFRGFPWKNTGSWNEKNINLIRNHFIEVYANGNPEHGDYLMKLEAWRVQNPNIKSRVAIVLQSHGQQCGFKSGYYSNVLQYLVGTTHHLVIDKVESLSDRFNTMRKGRLAVILEEISNWGGAHKSNDLIKNLLTTNKLTIEPKGFESYTVRDFGNYVFLTQHDFPVKIESGDVRIAVFKCSDKYKGDVEYFKALGKAFGVNKAGDLIDPDRVQDWFNFLMSIDLSAFDPQRIPETEQRAAIKERCVDPIVQYAIDAWGRNKKKIHHEAYKTFLRENSIRADSHTTRSFNTAFKNLLNPSVEAKQFRVDGSMEKIHGFIIDKTEGVQLIRKHLKSPEWDFEDAEDIDEEENEHE